MSAAAAARARRTRADAGPRRRVGALLAAVAAVVVATAGQLSWTGSASAAFTAAATRPPEAFVADVLDPAGPVSASRSCTAGTAPAHRGVSTASTQASSVTVPSPSLSAGDALVAFVIHHDTGNPPVLPSGWTELRRGGTSAGATLLAGRVTTASEPSSYTFTGLDPAFGTVAAVLAYGGVDQSAPWEAHAGLTTATTSVTAPSVTATTQNTRWVTGFLVDAYSGSVTVPSPTTQRTSSSAGGTAPVHLTVGDRVVSATGATGTQVAALSPSAAATGFSVLLRSAGAPKVTLSWTATPDAYAGGYAVDRTGSTTVWSVTPRATTSFVDASLPTTSAATYSVRAAAGSWRSPAVSVDVASC